MIDQILKLLNEEQKSAKINKDLHQKFGDKYGFVMYFEGQRQLLRRLKSRIKKLKSFQVIKKATQ